MGSLTSYERATARRGGSSRRTCPTRCRRARPSRCAASSPRPSASWGEHVSGASEADAARREGASAGARRPQAPTASPLASSSRACSTWRPTSPRWRSWRGEPPPPARGSPCSRVLSVRLRHRQAGAAHGRLCRSGPRADRGRACGASKPCRRRSTCSSSSACRSAATAWSTTAPCTCGPSKAPWPPTARSISGRTTRRSSPPRGRGRARRASRRLASLVCYDLEFPEAARVAALEGADLIAVCTADMSPHEHYQHVFARARAMENCVFVAVANCLGESEERSSTDAASSPTHWGRCWPRLSPRDGAGRRGRLEPL